MILIDTHIALWLYDARIELLSAKAQQTLNQQQAFLPQIARLELHLLHEIERINTQPEEILTFLSDKIGMSVSEQPCPSIIDQAALLSWTRDPFDRMIVAESTARNLPLITKDRKIQAHHHLVIW